MEKKYISRFEFILEDLKDSLTKTHQLSETIQYLRDRDLVDMHNIPYVIGIETLTNELAWAINEIEIICNELKDGEEL